MTLEIKNGDCLKYMAELPDKSIDLFLCDLPYLETNCAWDQKGVDLEEFWKQFKRLRKSKKTLCIHFCSTKFGYNLIKSNPKMFKMDMVWKKRNKTGGLQSRYRPMRNHEMVYFFYEQAPKYNRDKYHKRIIDKPLLKDKKDDKGFGWKHPKGKVNLGTQGGHFEPTQPASVLTDKDRTTDAFKKGECHAEAKSKYKPEHQINSHYEPPQIGSFVEEDEKSVWGQTKWKDGGDCGRLNEDGSYKKGFEPPNPSSVVEGGDVYNKACGGKGFNGKEYREKAKEAGIKGFKPPQHGSVIEGAMTEVAEGFGYTHAKKAFGAQFEPPNPATVVEDGFGYREAEKNENTGNPVGKVGANYEPALPASFIEERLLKLEQAVFKDERLNEKGYSAHGWSKAHMDKPRTPHFTPKLPESIVEADDTLDLYDFIENAEEAPYSVYASKKCFIGKRNHQTEKPLDILEFFLKYWSDEGDTVLDPTMGSGSTGVACAKLGRNFIGYEMNEKIFKVAEKRIKAKK